MAAATDETRNVGQRFRMESDAPPEDNQRAAPVTPDGKVKRALESGGPLLILGGTHDLSDSVRRLDGRAVEYLRVTLRAYSQVSQAR